MLMLRDPFVAEPLLRGFEPFTSLAVWDRLLAAPGLGIIPPTDLIETDDAVELVADMPGVRREDVEVEVKDGAIVLRGRRAAGGVASAFCRGFRLGDGYALDATSAVLEDGVLRVRIPKGTASAPKRIAVRGAEGGEIAAAPGMPGLFERAKRALRDLVRRPAA